MDVDRSTSKFRQATNYSRPQHSANAASAPFSNQPAGQNNGKRPLSSIRLSDQRRQRFNHLDQANEQEDDEEYDQLVADALVEVESESVADFEEDGSRLYSGQ